MHLQDVGENNVTHWVNYIYFVFCVCYTR